MRLKLAVESQGVSRDVLVTCDATATVGDVAARLAGFGVEQRRAQPVTLWVDARDGAVPRALNPLLSVQESGLRSGARVALVQPASAALLPGETRAQVEVVAGPDEGAVFSLGAGVSFIGRDPAAQVRLTDRRVSRRHASVTVSGAVVAADLNSANGVEVDGERVDRAVLTARSRLGVGDTVLRVKPVAATSVAVEPGGAFSRSPRVVEPWPGEELAAPVLPSPGERPRPPWIGVAAPIVAGAALFALTRNPLMLLFIALSPVLMVGMWVDQRVRFRRQRTLEAARFDEGLTSLGSELAMSRAHEQAARLAESPSTTQVGEAVASRSSLVWTRMPEHAAFLSVRFGLGILPSRSAVAMPGRELGSTQDWDRLKRVVDEYGTVPDVPVVERLADAGGIGFAGDPLFAEGMARAVLLQLAGLHSPADVAVCAFTTGDAAATWSWLKWLPHTDSPHTPVTASLAGDVAGASRLLAELEELVSRRLAAVGSRTVRSHLRSATPGAPGLWEPVGTAPSTPAVVVFVAGDAAVDRGRLVQVAQDGPDVGVFTVWLAGSPAELPVVCRTYATLGAASGTVSFVRHGSSVALTALELADPAQAESWARSLAPLEDDGAPIVDESDLPRQVALVDLFDDDIADDPATIVSRWSASDSLSSRWSGSAREPAGVGAVVGQGTSAAFRIDLRRDGPHALVGGTTGSGKSEFLQTWILGMAVENSPDRVTFLLVDYKGGSAFGDCVALPHTVGLVTDLSPHLVRRALTSLRAELRRREELLAAKGAKDLVTLEERGDPEAPPSLVIVIDEFAALVSDVPEFVDGVIDVAQRGRSLGLHLVMATQRPAGVIRESLRANTNLRVALRVADEADSQDVLGTDRAAHFDPGTPGRAAAKLGAGRVLDFQTAYAGGRSARAKRVDILVQDFPYGPAQVWPEPARQHRNERGPRDIERLVATIGDAQATLHLPAPRRPWLAPLPVSVDVAALAVSEDGMLTIGMRDEPAKQEQSPFTIDLDSVGSVIAFGTGGTGKSALLRTIAATASAGPIPAWVYGIDAAGGGLAGLRALPNVGAIIDLADAERIARLVRQLAEMQAERARLLASANASTLREYNGASQRSLPRVLVLIDGMAALRTEYEFHDAGRLFDGIIGLLSTGRQVGIHLIVTADRQGALPQQALATIQQRIVLRLASSADYDLLGVARDVLDDAPPGRALVDGTEVQLATPSGTADLSAQIAAIEQLAGGIAATAPVVRRLEEHIPWNTLPGVVDGMPTFGVADDTLQPVGAPTGLFVVTGPFRSGRTTALRTMIHASRRCVPDLPAYLLSARPGALVDATDWTESATDTDAAEELAVTLAETLADPATVPVLVVVEGSSDFEATGAETAVARLLKISRRNLAARLLVEADTVTVGGAWQIYTELKAARAGLVLQPEEADGAGIFRVQFPRATRADFPPGRGFYIDSGRIRRVQVATVPPRLSTGS